MLGASDDGRMARLVTTVSARARRRNDGDTDQHDERDRRREHSRGSWVASRVMLVIAVALVHSTLVTATTPPEPRPCAASTGPARRRGYLLVAAVVVVVAASAVVFAARSDPSSVSGPPVDVKRLSVRGPAPALHAKGWINSPALTPKDLSGKVVLYDFWTYSCINCRRTFPYLRSWFDRYRGDGLVIVGVHSPEFDFEKVHKNVEAAAKRLDVTWPIACSTTT